MTTLVSRDLPLSSTRTANLFPALTAATLVTSLIAGVAADLAWEFWARVITPVLPGVAPKGVSPPVWTGAPPVGVP